MGKVKMNKTFVKRFLSIVLAVITAVSVFTVIAAADGSPYRPEGGIKYGKFRYDYVGEFQMEEFGVTDPNAIYIVAYDGSETSVTVPASINGKKVVGIGWCAFYSCKTLTNVVIPSGVEFISNEAFCYCDNLKTITIPTSVK